MNSAYLYKCLLYNDLAEVCRFAIPEYELGIEYEEGYTGLE